MAVDVEGALNPYVSELIKSINEQFGDVEWGWGAQKFWTDEIFKYDIVHVHWPDFIAVAPDGMSLESRLKELKDREIIIFATCHNYVPHRYDWQKGVRAYQLVYGMADVMLHLGKYSLEEMSVKYKNARHILLFHHTYDKIYTKRYSKDESCKHLGLNPKKRYLLCFGIFRNDDEREFVAAIGRKLRNRGIKILTPSLYILHKRRNFIAQYWFVLRKTIHYRDCKISYKYINDDELPYYYGACDAALSQRVRILNSGNVTLAFLMGKVFVGPDLGNVGWILNEMGNPTFNPNSVSSAVEAAIEGIELAAKGKGEWNRQYSLEHFSTDVVAKRLHDAYKECRAK